MKNNNIIIVDNNINKEVCLFNEKYENINIIIKDNASLIIDYFNDIEKLKTKINIEIGNKSSLILNHSYLNKNSYELNIDVNYKSELSSVVINIKGINDNGLSSINAIGKVNTNNINNVLDEKIKIININNGKAICKPIMLINTSKVIANHENAIGSINEEELFYLMSKGLTKENAEKLICNGYLLSNMHNEELKDKIKEYLNGR